MFNRITSVAKKEFSTYFASPLGFIFLGTFLVINLFVFFWVEKFFARNVIDVRPLFEWMPVLLIFIVAALTMKMWSEEGRMGTLEVLLTLPVRNRQLVVGKFLACLLLVGVALILTLPIPITVSFMGNLDWGPVFGAYFASLLLAGSYIAIGLFISSKSENQIVSLILTSCLCLFFYLLGSDMLTALFGNRVGEFLHALGSGSRFQSITRGVLDIRDFYYYLSIIGIFLSLNVYSLEKYSWSKDTPDSKLNHNFWRWTTALLVLNFICGNFWLKEVYALRVDLTRGNMYSISDATKSIIERLQEPLLIRGYFSARTHPLLAPLVPQMRDLIREYEVAGRGKIRAEFIDPREKPEYEEEANSKYGIKPISFQIADKYQASVVNSYFNVVVQYGDKFEVLDFNDLIEVKIKGTKEIDVRLRNPEYDITRSIKKSLYGFQNIDSLFASLKSPVIFTAYISANQKLPKNLKEYRSELEKSLGELKEKSQGLFDFKIQDPDANNGVLAQEISKKYGFRPMIAGFFDPTPFYFYLTLQSNNKVVQLGLPEELTKESTQKNIEAGLKRFSSGFLKTIGLYYTKEEPPTQSFTRRNKSYNMLHQKLEQSYNVQYVDLESGSIPGEVDLLIVISPKNLREKEVFAIDQFLMKGGTVAIATSPISISRSRSSLKAKKQTTGLEEWLKHHGLDVEQKLVLDLQNENYPIPVSRNINGLGLIHEIKMLTYPPFVDIRADGMKSKAGITSGIPQVTLNWPSPIIVDNDKNQGRKVEAFLYSSKKSWATNTLEIQPDFQRYPKLGFAPSTESKPHPLAVFLEGEFVSHFKGKDSPLLNEKSKKDKSTQDSDEDKKEEFIVTSVLDKSPQSARIILYGSNEFLTDEVLHISLSMGNNKYLHSLQLMENTADWSLEDRSLLSIRGRAHFGRTLNPMDENTILLWEYLNYAIALIGLLLIYGLYRVSIWQKAVYYKSVLGS